MALVNMLEAKTHLSRLVEALESGAESEIVIARNGKPTARLLPYATTPPVQRIGVAKGLFTAPGLDPDLDAEVAALFGGAPAVEAR
jgi:antitoxin (DNA-binding transcriptional repressor) of toxin-antitoxin stability system